MLKEISVGIQPDAFRCAEKGAEKMPYIGSSNEGEWVGYVPFEELPHLYNPKNGFIITANQRTVGTDYKHFGVIARDVAMPWRAKRIKEILDTKKKISPSDARDAQYDVFNHPLKAFTENVLKLKVLKASNADLLSAWNGKMTPDSAAAAFANQMRNCTASTIAADNKGVPDWLIRERVVWKLFDGGSKLWLPKKILKHGSITVVFAKRPPKA